MTSGTKAADGVWQRRAESWQHAAPLPLLDSESVEQCLRQLPDWNIQNSRLTKTFSFDDGIVALGFVYRVGAAANERNHHPHIIWWKRDVRIELWTHESGGLSLRDFDLAACCDALRQA